MVGGKNDGERLARKSGKRAGLGAIQRNWGRKNDQKIIKLKQKPDRPQHGAYGHRARSGKASEAGQRMHGSLVVIMKHHNKLIK